MIQNGSPQPVHTLEVPKFRAFTPLKPNGFILY